MIPSSLEETEFTSFEKEFLRTLLASPSGLSIKQIQEKTGLSRAGIYKIYEKFQWKYVTITKKGEEFVRKRTFGSTTRPPYVTKLDPKEIGLYEFLKRLLSFGGKVPQVLIKKWPKKWQKKEVFEKARKSHYVEEKSSPPHITKKLIQKGTRKGQRSVAIFKLTDRGKEAVLYLYPSSKLSYIVDLGRKGEISLSFSASTLTSEDKYRYEAYWLKDPPLITPFLRAIDFDRLARRRRGTKPLEVNVSLRIKIPSKGVSRDILDATDFFTFLEEKPYVEQYWFWNENINWLETDVAKGQDVWETPYKDVSEVCDLLMKSSLYIFVATLLGLIPARKNDELYRQVFLQGSKGLEIYDLKFAPLNVFEFLLKIVPCIKRGKELEFSDDHLGKIILDKLKGRPEVKEWIERCLKRDGRYWLDRIPFERLGFKRNKEHISDSWIFDTNFPISLGVFYSMEKEKWRHIGAVMNILLDMIMLNKLPSRLGDMLGYAEYTDDVILEAWERVKGFWEKTKNNPIVKGSISRLHKKEMGDFFGPRIDLRDACCEFLDAVDKEWRHQDRKVKGTKELYLYLPGKISSSRPLELNPLYPFVSNMRYVNRYERIKKTIKSNTNAISSDKKMLRILGSRRKKERRIATEEYDPDKELEDYLKKLDYDDLMTKLAKLAKECPPYTEQL